MVNLHQEWLGIYLIIGMRNSLKQILIQVRLEWKDEEKTIYFLWE